MEFAANELGVESNKMFNALDRHFEELLRRSSRPPQTSKTKTDEPRALPVRAAPFSFLNRVAGTNGGGGGMIKDHMRIWLLRPGFRA